MDYTPLQAPCKAPKRRFLETNGKVYALRQRRGTGGFVGVLEDDLPALKSVTSSPNWNVKLRLVSVN